MSEHTVMINFRLTKETAKRLRIASAMHEETIQKIMARAVDEYLASRDSEQARETREGLAALAASEAQS